MTAQRNISWVEQGYIPDPIIRQGIKRLLKQRLAEIFADDDELSHSSKMSFINELKKSPIAISPEKANQQHYEIPAEFYHYVLGEHNKYSCCYWNDETKTLTDAEHNALQMTCQNAELEDGQEILELGCGWGSLTLWMAQLYPKSKITAVSNSNSQKKYIMDKAYRLNVNNVQVITCDMNDFDTSEVYDRIVSVEMFEHMRNWQALFNNVSSWLKDDGKFFMHVFSHRTTPYYFEIKDSSDWMSEYFFTGGMMPCDDLPLYFQNSLSIENSWSWSGCHYEKTANAWLKKMDGNKEQLIPLFKEVYGDDYSIWWERWRMFFMACAELFGYENGQKWHVMHYLFNRQNHATK